MRINCNHVVTNKVSLASFDFDNDVTLSHYTKEMCFEYDGQAYEAYCPYKCDGNDTSIQFRILISDDYDYVEDADAIAILRKVSAHLDMKKYYSRVTYD